MGSAWAGGWQGTGSSRIQQIIDIYERRQFRTMAGSICILIFGGRKFCILKYAYPDWPLLFRETQQRIKSA